MDVCVSLVSRAEVWAGDINLGVVRCKMAFNGLKLDELTQE